jgi:prepilin-type N-terminal cleavage/methylation domain-containing protein
MSRKGFTLLELLMVVIIIAILASIALPQYFRVTERSRISQVIQLLASVRSSELRYKATDPANLYTTVLGTLDLGALPASPAGWGVVAVNGTIAGSDVTIARAAGAAKTGGASVMIDLDNGAVCASTAAAATEWGLTDGSGGC